MRFWRKVCDMELEYLRPVVVRVIHTTVDFDYYENLYFSDGVIAKTKAALCSDARKACDLCSRQCTDCSAAAL